MTPLRDTTADIDAYLVHRESIERAIVAVCRHRHIQGSDAEDFAQDERLGFMQHARRILARFKNRSSLDTYVTTVVTNHLLNWQRARARRPMERLPERFAESRPSLNMADDALRCSEDAAATRGTLDSLRAAMACLTVDQRLLVMLRFDYGFDIRRVALDMEMTPKAASNRISRTVHSLRAELLGGGMARADAMAALEYLHEHGVPPRVPAARSRK